MASRQRQRDREVQPVLARFFLRPHHEPVLALGAVRRVLQGDEQQQQQLQVGRRPLQPSVRVVGVDDRSVVDRLASMGRGERLAVDRVPQQDRSAPRAGLLGRYRAQRPRERPRPANGRDGVVAGRHRLPPGDPLRRRLRLDRRAEDPAVASVAGLVGRLPGVGRRGFRAGAGAGRSGPVVAFGAAHDGPFALSEEATRRRDPDRLAAGDRVPLGRGLPQGRDRRPLRRVAEVHVGAGDQVSRVINVVPVRQVLNAAHVFGTSSYQPSEARPSTPLDVPPNIGLSLRCASTPSSKFRLSRLSTPRP